MSNPIYEMIGKNQNNNILAQFQQFRQQMQGVNPTEMLNGLLASGKISQEHLNQAQQMARQMQCLFDGLN